jgi:hypothetical protein
MDISRYVSKYTGAEVDAAVKEALSLRNAIESGELTAPTIQPDWNQADEAKKDFIKNKPVEATDEQILAWLIEQKVVEPIASASGAIYVTKDNKIFII